MSGRVKPVKFGEMSALIITDAVRIAFLNQLMQGNVFVGFGEGLESWGEGVADHQGVIDANKILQLPHGQVRNLTYGKLVVIGGITTRVLYTPGTDYVVDYLNGRVHVRPGSDADTNAAGSAEYEYNAEPEDPATTEIVTPLAYKKVLTKLWVQQVSPEDEFDYLVGGNHYALSIEPTRLIYVEVELRPEELSLSIIREVGIFLGTTVDVGFPEGQLLFQPEDVATLGMLYALKYYSPIIRNDYSKEHFAYILQF